MKAALPIVSFLLLVGCSAAQSDARPVAARFAEVTSNGRISLDKAALGRTLSLSRIYAIGTNIDQLNPLRTQLVYFERQGAGTVLLKEIRNGTTTPGADDRTLSSFSAEDTGTALAFDFDAGTKKEYVSFAVYDFTKEPKELVFDILDSSVRDARVTDGALLIQRDETADVPGSGPVELLMSYRLEPYTANAGFEPRPNNAVNGFYVNVPVTPVMGGEPVAYAHRHDVQKPIVYHVSSAMPAERLADVTVAVGYWNKIFSSIGVPDPIALEPLAAGMQPLEATSNVIDWRSSPADGAGRGVNVTDPLTGQIMRSIVTVTSVFEIQGTDVATTRWAVHQLNAGKSPKPLPEAALTRMVSDYYVETFAHEIGHGLGIRHNFAGNLTSTVDAKSYERSFEDYLASDLPEGAVPSSSVMEYLESSLAALVGAHIREGRAPLAYDVQAIASMYGASMPELDFGLYCERESSAVFVDCAEFDQGSDTVLGSYSQWENTIDETAFKIAKSVVTGATLESPDVDALILLDPLSRLAAHLDQDANYLAILAQFPGDLSEAQQEQYKKAVLARQKQSFHSLDGPHVQFVRDLVQSGLDTARCNDLAKDVRARTEAYLATYGVSADSALLDAYFSVFAQTLGEQAAPLNDIAYACVTC